MNVKAQKSLGIQPKGIGWKPGNGLELKTRKGMEIRHSDGLQLGSDDSYFKVNHYKKLRKYLQMGSCIPAEPKPKVTPRKEPDQTRQVEKETLVQGKEAEIYNEEVSSVPQGVGDHAFLQIPISPDIKRDIDFPSLLTSKNLVETSEVYSRSL